MIIHYEDLADIRERHASQTIVFASGVFDLTHIGHALFLERCKKEGDILVVLVGDDTSVRNYKGEERPILRERVRLAMVDFLRPVDYCFIGTNPPGRIFEFVAEVLKRLRPDKYVVQSDAAQIPQRRCIAEAHHTSLVLLPFPEGEFSDISTGKILERARILAKK